MKLSDIPDAIVDARKAGRSLWLNGPPGIGKTAIANQARELLGIEMIGLRAVEHEPVDFGGFPTVGTGDRVKRLREEWVPREGTEGILFIDELGQATVETQCAAMRLVDDLPSGWSVVAASNRTTDRAGVRQSPTHVLSRFTHISVDVDRAGWQAWAADSGVHPLVRGFIDFRPEHLMPTFDAALVQAERTSCNPRSWAAVSEIVRHARQSVKDELVCGTIGNAVGSEFRGYCQIAENCPHTDEILKHPEEAIIPKDPSALFVVTAALADRARTMDKGKLPAMIAYLVRLPVEFGALLITDVLRVHSTVLTIPAASKWVSKHSDIFASPRK